ncbi:MAG: tetratricopeptide repeat protein [Methanoregulaceae archaeon]|nr:tetratricopeptide repeat protein [Methanoregulaceae archaeon]
MGVILPVCRLRKEVVLLLLMGAILLVLVPPVSGDSSYEMAISWTQKGDLLFTQGRYAEALDAYDQAIALDPYNSHEWNKKGESLSMLGRYVDAIQAFEKTVELDPYYTKAWDNKGDAFYRLGMFTEANDAFDRAIAVNPNDLHALVNKGISLERLSKPLDAEKEYYEVIRIAEREVRVHPNEAKYDADLWNDKGVALYHLGRTVEAMQAYDKALSINPKHTEAQLNRDIALREAKEIGGGDINSTDTNLAQVNQPTSTPISPIIVLLSVSLAAIIIYAMSRKNR